MKKLYNLELSKTVELGEKTASVITILESLLQHKEIIKWAELLCGIGNIEDFMTILSTSKSELLAIMKYRRILHQQGNNISFIELNTAYTNKQFDKLHKLLEEMFLEPIQAGQFEFIVNRIDTIEDGIEKLYERHMRDKGLRVLSVTSIL